MGVLNPKGVIAIAEKNLLLTALSLMAIIIIPVFVMLFSFAWRYRASNTKAKYTPNWNSNKPLEIIWWTAPTIIILLLSGITWKSTHELDPYKPLQSTVPPITIQVVALDWKWLFIYPEENIATVNFIQFPKDTPVNFIITADAPMNAFWIPQLGGQVYAMSGMTSKLHISSHEVGSYKGLSSNFSGDGFSGMTFEARVTSQEDYRQWVNTVQGSPYSLTQERYTELAKKTMNHPVEYYTSTDKNVYTSIIMKYMAPMKKMDHTTHDQQKSIQPASTQETSGMDHAKSH